MMMMMSKAKKPTSFKTCQNEGYCGNRHAFLIRQAGLLESLNALKDDYRLTSLCDGKLTSSSLKALQRALMLKWCSQVRFCNIASEKYPTKHETFLLLGRRCNDLIF